MLGLPLEQKPVDDSDGAKEIAEQVDEDFWDLFPEDTSGELLRYGLMVGACAAELVWTLKERRMIPKLKVWHPSLLRYDQEKRQYSVKLESGSELPIRPGDGKWLVSVRRQNHAQAN